MKPARYLSAVWTAALKSACALLVLATMAGAKPASEEALHRATQAFQKANGAYEKNDYSNAAELYRQAIDEGVADSRLYFNYANSLFRLNQPGMAILYYEKARKLNPDDDDIAYNLRFANAQIVDKVPAPENNALTRILWYLHASYSINVGLWICLALFSGIFLAAIAALFSGSGMRGVIYTAMVLAALVLATLGPSLIYKINQQESLQYGIVLKPAAEMLSGPGENFQVLTKVHEGTKLEIVDTRGDWVSVKLANGKGGFVRLSDLGKV
jgi:tetratricopeptide (TPR) repeat protein